MEVVVVVVVVVVVLVVVVVVKETLLAFSAVIQRVGGCLSKNGTHSQWYLKVDSGGEGGRKGPWFC